MLFITVLLPEAKKEILRGFSTLYVYTDTPCLPDRSLRMIKRIQTIYRVMVGNV